MKKPVSVGIIIAVAVIAFTAGMEYKAYQFRSVVQDAFGDLGKAFSGEPTDKKPEILVTVKKGESYTMKSGIKLSIDSQKNVGPVFSDGYLKYTAQNTFYKVTMTGENTGTQPIFESLSSAKIELNGITYNSSQTIQETDKKQGFGNCISCSMNPGDKSIESILFDINVPTVDGGKVILEGVAFDV